MDEKKIIIGPVTEEEYAYFNELSKLYDMTISDLVRVSVRKYFWASPPMKLMDSNNVFDPSPLMEFEKNYHLQK